MGRQKRFRPLRRATSSCAIKLAGGKFYEQETAETRSIASGSEQDDYVSRRAPSTAPAFLLRKAGQKNSSLGFIDKLQALTHQKRQGFAFIGQAQRQAVLPCFRAFLGRKAGAGLRNSLCGYAERLFKVKFGRYVDFVGNIFSVLFALADTFGKQIFDLTVDRAEIVLRPGGDSVVQLGITAVGIE